jgi:hypothetical protein
LIVEVAFVLHALPRGRGVSEFFKPRYQREHAIAL